ncbi:MAG TPA: DUF4097 family beta strand repeat-containing protein [Chthoniobacterales bacterium]|nr:DUF4097 family beta strand repeat-containing protein [Chthoniobacterales bacterium]
MKELTMNLTTKALTLILATTLPALAAEDQIHETRPAQTGGELVVDVDFGSITVTPGESDKVTVDAHRKVEGVSDEKAKQYLADTPIRVTTEGNKVIVRERRRHESLGGLFSWLGSIRTEAHFNVRVPANFRLDLDTSGGSISASGTTGAVKADTSGGKLAFEKIHGDIKGDTSGGAITAKACEGNLNLDTSGGHIEVADGRGQLKADTSGGRVTVLNFAGDTQVESSGGKLRLANIGGKLTAETSGGAIEAILPSPIAGDVSLDTSAGSVTVMVPANAGLTIDAETGSGHVQSDLQMSDVRSDNDSLKATVNGGGKRLVLRSGAGSIRIVAADHQTAQK